MVAKIWDKMEKMDILPEDLKVKYSKWMEVSPRILEYQEKDFFIEGLYSLTFFMEFSIPYIWKWQPSYGITDEQLPCLKRFCFSKYWDKMNRIDPETKKSYAYDTICEIDRQIKVYQQKQKNKKTETFDYVMGKIRAKAMGSRQEIIKAYLEEMKKDLMILEDETMSRQSNKTDASMEASSQHLFQDSQDIEEPNMDDVFEAVKEFISEKVSPQKSEKGESSKTAKNKET